MARFSTTPLLVLQVALLAAADPDKWAPDRILVRFQVDAPGLEGKELPLRGLRVVPTRRGETVEQAVARFSRNPNVLYAEPDYIVKAISVTPNDQFFSSHQWGMTKIQAPQAWALAKGSSQVRVCVHDTGIQKAHPDLDKNTVEGRNLYNTDAYGWADKDGHGSHCAGVIGATANNGIGVAGLNWDVQMVPCKSLSDTGSGTASGIINCIYYCHSQASISSNSWGFQSSKEPRSVTDAVRDVTNKGHLFIVAAGNSNCNNDKSARCTSWPAAARIAGQISVAASDQSDARASFSSYGVQTTHLAAPGVSIASTMLNNYYLLSGTSMSTPHVAGVAALVKAINPNLSAAAIKNIILNTVDKTSGLSTRVSSGGRLNAYKAVQAAQATLTS